MRMLLGMATLISVALAVPSTTGASAQSSEPTPPFQRHESDFFAITFPSYWVVTELSDEEGASEPPGYGFVARDPISGTVCAAWAYILPTQSAEDLAREFASPSEADGRSTEVVPVDLGSGEAWVVNTSLPDTGGLPRVSALYSLELGPVRPILGCNGPFHRRDDWRLLADSIESLVPDDGLELGWPDVPLTEQQAWERISPVIGIARRQMSEILRTNAADLPWYVMCKDRLHEAVPTGDGGWDGHLVLRAIEGGDACWATRNPESTDWDYSGWTTPEEATEAILQAALQEGIDAAIEKSAREQYGWECTQDGQVTIVYVEDQGAPDWWGPDCVLVSEPEQGPLVQDVPPVEDDVVDVAGLDGAAPSGEDSNEPMISSGKGSMSSGAFRLSGSYRVEVTTENCRTTEFSLSQVDLGPIAVAPRRGIGSIRNISDGDYFWDVETTRRKANKPCRWSLTLHPVAD